MRENRPRWVLYRQVLRFGLPEMGAGGGGGGGGGSDGWWSEFLVVVVGKKQAVKEELLWSWDIFSVLCVGVV